MHIRQISHSRNLAMHYPHKSAAFLAVVTVAKVFSHSGTNYMPCAMMGE